MTVWDRTNAPETSATLSRAMASVGRLKILVADDHCLVRDAVSEIIRLNSKHEVFVADSLKSAFTVIEDVGTLDIVLLDLNMPDMEGVKSFEKMVATQGVKAVVLFSGNAPREIVLQTLAKGVKGFIPKNMRLTALLNALNCVAIGETYLPSSFLSGDRLILQKGAPATWYLLNVEEEDVLRLVVEGLPNKEIARQCGSTEVRVKMYMRSICRKLGVPNRTSAAIKARDLNLF